ncbi:Ger(x)C family spore germination protein [Clostridium felsineum]|uniref:Ger(x)C family spore germination protein n=1 Tax=Clostridium felsineum TaxID=36839 RepID=UPI00098CA6D1|nr:Ger(x)C family spore germination protein [Clostridium felsineum]URZ01823.1 hypothetical protein CLAUR_018200 [Clostridium felsineum]
MQRNNKIILITIILIFVLAFFSDKGELVENLQIPIAIGADIEKNAVGTIYKIPVSIYSFEGAEKVSSYVLSGEGFNLPSTRDTRQLKSDKKFMLGLNRVFIFSEGSAQNGLNPFIDLNLNNPQLNDRALCTVCRGKAEDIINYKAKDNINTSDYIDGMIRNLKQFNFFSSQYSFMDIAVRVCTEGRATLLPYIEIKDGEIQTTGLAIFNKDKMVGNVDMAKARVINMIKENNVWGIVTIQEGSKYTSLYGKTKNKVKCYKKDGKYSFVINLSLSGKIINNTLYKNLNSDVKQMERFKLELGRKVEKDCNDTIKDVMKEYKVDVLDLGRAAAAKYGRHTGVDWNKIVSNSDIKVNVKIKVINEGRGNY